MHTVKIFAIFELKKELLGRHDNKNGYLPGNSQINPTQESNLTGIFKELCFDEIFSVFARPTKQQLKI